jgi:hypothetical protein
MLMKTETKPARRLHPTSKRAPVTVITALNVAKARRGKKERAELAAEFAKGNLLVIQPTVALASKVFEVSQTAVHHAITDSGAHKASALPPLVDQVWATLDTRSREQFVQSHLLALWDHIEAITA